MELTRRGLLGGIIAGGAALTLPMESSAWGRGFRFVHMTDLHIQPELGAADGVALAVKKVLSLKPRPQFVIFGGDGIMDALNVTRERADLQFRLLAEALKPLEMPIHYAVGNHDVFGWGSREIQQTDAGYGKALFAEKVSQKETYYAFEFGACGFIVLDSIAAKANGGWTAEIDDAQMQWLQLTLKRLSERHNPIFIVSHVPIMTLFGQYTLGTTIATPESLIVRNGKEVRKLFKGYNVKAVLQGHTHVVEDCAYTGTHYITSGAVCGDWWKGLRLGVHPEGFGVYDVRADTFEWEYVPYGWKART